MRWSRTARSLIFLVHMIPCRACSNLSNQSHPIPRNPVSARVPSILPQLSLISARLPPMFIRFSFFFSLTPGFKFPDQS
ncbi:hypothetical protein EDD21DRAFT_386361 [Dissophora ornata]|nr:hypothetical protein EDD21DRAFT_386361 [Dissophora ornata]